MKSLRKNRDGFSLVEIMISVGVLGLTMLAFSNLIQSQMKSIAQLEDKLSAVDMENLVNRLIASEDSCKNSFVDLNLAVDAEAASIKDAKDNEIISKRLGFDRLSISKISVKPTSIAPGGGVGYAQLRIELASSRSPASIKPIEKEITVTTDASRRVVTCATINKEHLTGEAPIQNSKDGTHAVEFPPGFFTEPPSNITITPKWARFTSDEDTTWWIENVSSTGFEIRWKGPGSGDNTPGTDGVYWRADK